MIAWQLLTLLLMLIGIVAIPLAYKWALDEDCFPAFVPLIFLMSLALPTFVVQAHRTVEMINQWSAEQAIAAKEQK